jgi:hypothetical protein
MSDGMMRRARKRPLWTDDEGAAVVELALTLPLLLLLFFGGFELTRFILITHKLEKAAYTVSDVVAQQTSVTMSQLEQIMSAASEVMKPYEIGDRGTIVLSSVYQNGSDLPTVQWQYAGGGTLTHGSNIGVVGGPAALPGGLTLNDKDNIIVTEVFYTFEPLFPGWEIGPSNLYKYAIFKPRLGALTTAPN